MTDLFRKTAMGAVKEIEQVFTRMQEVDVRGLMEAIKSTQRIFLLGAGREGISTKAFAMRLKHLGKEVYWIWDDTTPSICQHDLMICACGSADVGHENYITQKTKELGATLALITAANKGYILEIADIVVKVPAQAYKAVGDFVTSRQLMGNLFEQTLFILFDVIVMLLKEEMKITDQDMTNRHRNVE